MMPRRVTPFAFPVKSDRDFSLFFFKIKKKFGENITFFRWVLMFDQVDCNFSLHP